MPKSLEIGPNEQSIVYVCLIWYAFSFFCYAHPAVPAWQDYIVHYDENHFASHILLYNLKINDAIKIDSVSSIYPIQ